MGRNKIKKLADDIIALSERHGLDVSQYGGRACPSGRPGHLLQIFMRRCLVDQLAYAAKPYGEVDAERQPLSTWLGGSASTNYGQARVVAHPKLFMTADSVRMHVASADESFHTSRQHFQSQLTQLLKNVFF